MRTGISIQVYLTPEMRGQLEQLAERNVRTMSAEVVIALRRHLAEAGFGDNQAPGRAPAPKKTRERKK
jgi:hypothetical protein